MPNKLTLLNEQEKKNKASSKKAKNDTVWGGLTDKQKVETLREAFLALAKAIEKSGSNGS